MAPCADSDSPTDFVPPPSYQISQEQFDRKTSHAIQLSSSIQQPITDDDGWPIYDATAFEAVAKSYEHSSGSSSAGLSGADVPRHGRQASYTGLPSSTDSMKTKSGERRRRNHRSDREYPSERLATPPPPFSATGPSLDGPPFEDVVTLSYYAPPDSQGRPPSLSPVTQPAPLRLPSPGPSQRVPDPPTRPHAHSNPYRSHRQVAPPPNIPSGLRPSSAITRVEFDPQMAYWPNGRNGNNASIQGGASSFYNHAVASQLTASANTVPNTPQTSYHDRSDGMSAPYSSGYSESTYGRYQATSPVSQLAPDEPHTTRPHSHRFSSPASLQSGPHMVSSTTLPPGAGYAQGPSGAARGPLPPAPYSQWAGNEGQLVQDIYGVNG